MAYIKHTCIATHSHVFIINAGIANGHIVPGKFSKFGAEVNMFLIERCILHY